LLLGGVTEDEQPPGVLGSHAALLAGVDDHERHAFIGERSRNDRADPADADHDVVPAQSADPLLHATSFQKVPQVPFHHEFDDRPERVGDAADAGEDKDDREDASRV
jgi:hypothetical protein